MHPEIVIPILLMILISCGTIGLIIFVLLNSSIALRLYKTKKPDKDINIRRTYSTASWAQKNDFDFLGFYTVQYGSRDFMAAWKLKEKPRFLYQYIIGTGRESATVWDFITIFESDIELITASTKDSNLFPKPQGIYNQSFSVPGFDELYRIHLQSEEYLVQKGGAQITKPQIDFEENFVNSLKKTNKYHWKHWYGVFLLLYFFFVRRNKWHSKTIEQQHELGMIQLPNEIFRTVL